MWGPAVQSGVALACDSPLTVPEIVMEFVAFQLLFGPVPTLPST